MSRIQEVLKLSSEIFGNIYNPTSARIGSKVLRQKLKGPTISSYYPQTGPKLATITKAFPELNLIDYDALERKEEISRKKRRGKGAPKKGEGKRAGMKKK
ncbi:mitochondral 37S ribosomal protein S27 [Basidiobolus ranarum]|uniref:Small ribosomal subunit protein mS33 n=1 Tax=Basidiobolus ranarum TaxID=34480 RepID=A0ABR2WZZ4_9FUNG